MSKSIGSTCYQNILLPSSFEPSSGAQQKRCKRRISWRIFWQKKRSPRCNGSHCDICRKSDNPMTQTTNPNRLCAVLWRASNWDFVRGWSFRSLPQCLRRGTAGLNENCWECWSEHGQLTQKHKYQNANEKEWLIRVDDAQGFPWASLLDSVSNTHSKNWSAGTPSTRKPPSIQTMSDSALLWETADGLLHIHENEANVCDQNTHSTPPDVDFESHKSPANGTS